MDKNPTARVATALLVLLVPLSILLFGLVAPAAAGDPQALTETDKTLLIKVRQAGLWEMPAGQEAQQQAASQVVRDVGAKIAAQHQALDEETRVLAQQLGVPLPNQPSEEQQAWLNELAGKFGPEFDRAFAQLLRAAHGKVFSAIAQVRAGTRNNAIREFASHANDVVKGHMTMLESTGQVNFDALPEPNLNPPAANADVAHTAGHSSTVGGINTGLVIAVALVMVAMTLGLIRVVRTR
jgi:predicted outer membrane protein